MWPHATSAPAARQSLHSQPAGSIRAPDEAVESQSLGTSANRDSYSVASTGTRLAQRRFVADDDGAPAPAGARQPRSLHTRQRDRSLHHPIELGARAVVQIAQRLVRTDQQLSRDAMPRRAAPRQHRARVASLGTRAARDRRVETEAEPRAPAPARPPRARARSGQRSRSRRSASSHSARRSL